MLDGEMVKYHKLPKLQDTSTQKLNLNQQQRKQLLEERQEIIEQAIIDIQYNFFRIGKALAEIKNYKLFKADPLFSTWSSYIKNRIIPKLHQSTISDYIAIVRMQLSESDYMVEEEIVKLGYKKAKLLKNKLNVIKQIEDDNNRNVLLEKFKNTYQKSFKEFSELPYRTYEYQFNFIPPSKKNFKRKLQIIEHQTKKYSIKLNTISGIISITPKTKHENEQDKLLDKIVQQIEQYE